MGFMGNPALMGELGGAIGAKRQGQRRGSAGQLTQPQLHSDTI